MARYKPRYKPYDLKQDKLVPVSYRDQIVPGSFEHALNEIVEEHLDLSVFEQRYRNEDTGRLAYDPKVLLKIVLYGYYKGIISSRKLAEACCRNVVFTALSARPHFTTIAAFVSELEDEIVALFRDVLLYAEELGLIGKEHFAVDGCKLPSNASKQWSGTHEELRERQEKGEVSAVPASDGATAGGVLQEQRGSGPKVAGGVHGDRSDETEGGQFARADDLRAAIATVEPVFANLQNKGMRRFTLRGRRKVNVQWKLYTLVHNVEKIANFAAA
jgi:transposase